MIPEWESPEPGDEADKAFEQQEHFLQESLRIVQSKRLVAIVGSCYNCGDPTPSRLFCDLDCEKDWERRRVILTHQLGTRQ